MNANARAARRRFVRRAASAASFTCRAAVLFAGIALATILLAGVMGFLK